MKKLLFILLLSVVNCFAMSEEQQKQKIKHTLKKMNDSSKDSDFFAFYDLYMCIKNPDQPISPMHKEALQAAGLLNGDELKPFVKDVFLEYAQEDEFKNTMLLPMDLE